MDFFVIFLGIFPSLYFGILSQTLPGSSGDTKLLASDFILSDRKKIVERRYVLEAEYDRFLKEEKASESSKRRYNNPIRKARRWKQILDDNPDLNNTLLAKRLRISRVRVVHVLSLLRLPQWAQEKILKSIGISERSLRPLVHIQSKKVFKAAFEQVLKQAVSPQDREKKVKKHRSPRE